MIFLGNIISTLFFFKYRICTYCGHKTKSNIKLDSWGEFVLIDPLNYWNHDIWKMQWTLMTYSKKWFRSLKRSLCLFSSFLKMHDMKKKQVDNLCGTPVIIRPFSKQADGLLNELKKNLHNKNIWRVCFAFEFINVLKTSK